MIKHDKQKPKSLEVDFTRTVWCVRFALSLVFSETVIYAFWLAGKDETRVLEGIAVRPRQEL